MDTMLTLDFLCIVIVRLQRNKLQPFGGAQIVFLGDVMQLEDRSVQEGECPFFETQTFKATFPMENRFRLSGCWRQSGEGDAQHVFRSVLAKVRLGIADEETISFFERLQRLAYMRIGKHDKDSVVLTGR
jgi:hypothetical protein